MSAGRVNRQSYIWRFDISGVLTACVNDRHTDIIGAEFKGNNPNIRIKVQFLRYALLAPAWLNPM
jgi:hypothetical protein